MDYISKYNIILLQETWATEDMGLDNFSVHSLKANRLRKGGGGGGQAVDLLNK